MKEKGFTLLEVMVALIIVVICFGAILTTLNALINQQQIVKNKMLTVWVAENLMAKVKMQHFPSLSTNKKIEATLTMGSQSFKYAIERFNTENEQIKRIEVSVLMLDSAESFVLTGYGLLP